ncbi:hypothetical protein [Sporisorium scitamineum]|uniref:Uncharacterized protein n=1 Tax=Sporisorium scitamineum TaxID=49012 RepID=A0A0F7RTA5_9BASI|nr:hypothetical protein [Sporisorium scitamineum]
MPAHGATVSDPSKAKWSSDLSSLNFFPLPQAPPLQPEHRYPISILETDGHYETDLDTDRESDTSPSVSRSFIVTSRSAISGSSRFKRKSLDTTQCDRKPSMTAMGNYQSQDKPATSEAHSSGADGTLKVVPLSNVVRSRSFSSASRSPSGGHNVYTWPAGSVESLRAAHLARSHSIGAPDTTAHVSEAARLSSGQVAASTYKSDTASSTARDSSYDFTRQTLLDLIRRTNLGIANNASSSETSGATSSKNTSSSREAVSAPQVPSSSYSAPPFGSSSNVPADLQAHLQSWQHHRKRQKLFGEALNETSKDQTGSSSSITPSNCNGRSTLDNSASLNELSVEELPRSSTRSSIDEQDHKMRRQERYQRMLLQINEQMQIKMRMNMQKQKQKEAQDKVQHEGSTKRTGDSSKEVEFRKPGPPSKTSTARRMSLDLPSNPNRGCDSSKGTMNGSSRVRGSMIQEARSHGTRPGTPTPNANLSTVRSNENTFNAGARKWRLFELQMDGSPTGWLDFLAAGLCSTVRPLSQHCIPVELADPSIWLQRAVLAQQLLKRSPFDLATTSLDFTEPDNDSKPGFST